MEDVYWLLFHFYKPLHSKRFLKILDELESLENLLDSPETKLMNLGLTDNEINNVLKIKNIMKFDSEKIRFFEELLEKLEAFKITVIKITDKNYPTTLREINDPPIVLFHRGSLKLEKFKNGLAIIGTRNASFFGRKVARKIARDLALYYTIISGLARGIDTEAHCGALENAYRGEKTLAVLAWMDPIYPGENEELSKDIIKHGAIISENFVKPNADENYIKNLFIKRDRIISALADALIVVETGEKGGTIHTVRFAKKYNKKIFVIEPPPEHFKEKRRSINGYTLLKKVFGAIKVPYTSEISATKFILKNL